MSVTGPGANKPTSNIEFKPVDAGGPAPAEAAAPVAAPAVDAKAVEKDVDTIYKAMKGAGTNEKAIFSTLEGRGVPEREAIEKRFGEKYARLWPSLRHALADEMGGDELKRAVKALDAGKSNLLRGENMTDLGKGGGAMREVRHFGTWFMFGHGDAKKAAADGCPRVLGQEVREKMLPNLKPGDVILCGNGGNVTHAIVYAGNGKVIHSMASKETMRTYGERFLDTIKAPLHNIQEAAGKRDSKQGVIEEGVDEFFDRFERDTFVVMRSPNLDPEGTAKGLEKIKSLVGKDYDWDFAPGNDSYYCTEVVGEFLRTALGENAPRIGARPVKQAGLLDREAVVDPLDVLESPDMKPVLFNEAAKKGPIKETIGKARDV